MYRFLAYKLGLFFVRRLSLKAAYQLAQIISDMQYFMSVRDKRSVRNNLRKILGKSVPLGGLDRQVFRNFGKYLVEFFRMESTVTPEYIKSHVKVEHLERLARVLKEGKGAIILTAHMGNWELGAVLLQKLGFPISVVALPHKERSVDELFNHQRRVQGIEVIPSYSAARKCIEKLKRNEIVALVGDRDFTGNGIEMNFLGSPARIPKGAAIFAQKTKTAIVPVFAIRNDDGTFTLTIEEAISPRADSDNISESMSIFALMKECISVIEKQIRKNPSQWMMFREFSTQ